MQAFKVRHGAYLPHWTGEDATYALTFRLADSLPASVLRRSQFERDDILRTARQLRRKLTQFEEMRLDELFSESVDRYLDAGYGDCWMRRDIVAGVVVQALLHFDRGRYQLIAWCVMPNHVHAVLRPLDQHELPEILHTWKSFTANAANKIIGRSGQFWHAEYYDHLIRDELDMYRQVEYVLNNPSKARLSGWKWAGRNP